MVGRDSIEMLTPRGQTGLEAKILASASASGRFSLGLKLLASASNWPWTYIRPFPSDLIAWNRP